MAQATLVLPALSSNTSAAAAGDVAVAVRLLGPAPAKPVSVTLRLLAPGNSSSLEDSTAQGSGSSSWPAADPDELWLEPAVLSWRAGERPGAKLAHLRSASGLPAAIVLEDALYAGSSDSSGGSGDEGMAAGQPLLRVELASATGAAIDEQHSSTTVVVGAEAQGSGDGSSTPSDPGIPLFGFLANQAAYPPSSSSSSSSTGSPATIPVRLLTGQLTGAATLRYKVHILAGPTSGIAQFLPTRALSGFLYFQAAAQAPAPSAELAQQAGGVGIGGDGELLCLWRFNQNLRTTVESRTDAPLCTKEASFNQINVWGAGGGGDGDGEQQQFVSLPLSWDRIPAEAEYRLGGC
jgi:hypothetical protein